MTDNVVTDYGAIFDIVARIVEIVGFLAAALLFIFKGGASAQRLENALTALKEHFIAQNADIKELQQDFKQIAGVLTQLAVQDTRLNALSDGLRILDQRYEELRHGEGFVYPIGAHLKPPD